jgi:hypothetical protein
MALLNIFLKDATGEWILPHYLVNTSKTLCYIDIVSKPDLFFSLLLRAWCCPNGTAVDLHAASNEPATSWNGHWTGPVDSLVNNRHNYLIARNPPWDRVQSGPNHWTGSTQPELNRTDPDQTKPLHSLNRTDETSYHPIHFGDKVFTVGIKCSLCGQGDTNWGKLRAKVRLSELKSISHLVDRGTFRAWLWVCVRGWVRSHWWVEVIDSCVTIDSIWQFKLFIWQQGLSEELWK